MPSFSIKIFSYLLPLYLFLLPWQTVWIVQAATLNESNWTYGTMVYYLTEFLLWIVIGFFVWWYIQAWKKEKRERHTAFRWSMDRVFFLSLLLVVIYAYLSIVWAPNHALAWQHARWIMQALIFFLVLLMAQISKETMLRWFVYGAVGQVLIACVQFFTQSTVGFVPLGLVEHIVFTPGTSIVESVDIGRWLRPYAAFSHPNVLGGYLSIALLACAQILQKNNGEEQRKKFLLFFVLFLLIAFGIFISFSRTAWGVGGVVLVWTLWQLRHHPRAWLWQSASVVLLGILTLIYFPLVNTRLVPSSVSEVRSVSERVSYVDHALEIWSNSKWFGVGVGNYTAALYEKNPDWHGWEYQPVHTVPLLVLVEFGLVGSIIIFLASITGIFFLIENKRVTSVVFIGIVVAIGLTLFDHYLYSSYVGLILEAWLCAIVYIKT